MRFTASEIAAAADGTLSGPDRPCIGAAIDSRTIAAGALFVPVVAERNGHEFIPAALSAGAAAYLTSEGPAADASDGTAITVVDTVDALSRLGAVARDRLPDRVIGITGSVGKTSVKDLAAAALASTFRTAASEKSFNNELGVPLTLVNAPDDTEAAVVEMGARGAGHIASLCPVVRPTIGVVTTVGAAHTELFGTVEDVAQAKGELIEAVPADGTAVLNAEHPLVAAMASRTEARVLTFGRESGDVRAADVELDAELRPRFRLLSPWGEAEVALAVHGDHNVVNALAAAAIALAAGSSPEAAAAGMATAALSPWRMEITTTERGAVVINDAYNANPMSMTSALRSLAAIEADRRVAVVGMMAELGVEEREEHEAIARLADDLSIELIVVGTDLYGRPPVADHHAAAEALGPVDRGDAVLVKGSRVAGLEELAVRLLA
ncbi:MAG: UDP-N-acetylmuramoyl-tripeptide--D-alanyl-D-alanine ligase [Actinomycetota bacterium]